MMTSKRKQEEKHLNALKALQQIQSNKRCSECDQRGPTYVDVTIGSFVCTSCGGILRGLNPPHRVKSVSMATFTPTEIAFMESRGNEYCRNIYLGKYDARSKARPESKDQAKLKFFMEQKYEQKRWYVAPEQAQKSVENVSQASSAGSKNEQVKPLSSLLGKDPTPLRVEKSPQPLQQPKVDNVLADFSTPVNAPSSNQLQQPGGFADFSSAFSTSGFDAFGDFTSGQSNNTPVSTTSGDFTNFSNMLAPATSSATSQNQANKPADKYADLADLFSLDNTAGATADSSAMWSGFSGSATSNASLNPSMSVFGMSPAQPSASLANQPQNASVFGNAQPTSVFGNTQPASVFGNTQPASVFGNTQPASVFGNTQPASAFGNTQPAPVFGNIQPAPVFGSTQPQQNVFGTQQTPSVFGNVPQSNFMSHNQPATTGSFFGSQQPPQKIIFSSSQQPSLVSSPYSNMQQQTPAMTAGSFGTAPFSTTGFGAPSQTGSQFSTPGFGATLQTGYGAPPHQSFGSAAKPVVNPFMQPNTTPGIPAQGGSNPFMMQQRVGPIMSNQPAATNPFMSNPAPASNPMPTTNPFF